MEGRLKKFKHYGKNIKKMNTISYENEFILFGVETFIKYKTINLKKVVTSN